MKRTKITEVIDYNGDGKWSLQSVQERYLSYAKTLKIFPVRDLTSQIHEHWNRQWVYPIMREVIDGIEQGDRACIAIGIEFIEEDQGFAFGRILKSNTARALRRADLTTDQVERIRKRVIRMLTTGSISREYREYAKLLRKIGMGDWWPYIEEHTPQDNPYVTRYYNYFEQYVRPR